MFGELKNLTILWFVNNWAWGEAVIEDLPVSSVELFSNKIFKQGDALMLGSWDVKIIVDEVLPEQ